MLQVTIDRRTHLTQAPARLQARLRERLTFANPAYQEAERLGLYSAHIPPELCFLEETDGGLVMPRGFTRQALGIVRGAGVDYRLEDRRRILPPVDFDFKGELKGFQAEAVETMAGRDFGTLAAPTGSGKTVMALALVARRRQPALVVVHTKELLEQWVSRIETFLGIPGPEVGRVGGGKMRVGERITVALVQTLYKCAGEAAPRIGFLIADECHRTPARTFTETVTAFDCRYMLGLSATPWRRDGLSRLIFWHLGDVAHQVERRALMEAGHILEAEVIWRETDFTPTFDPSEQYSRMLSELTRDPERNALIAADVAREAGNGGGVCLVLTDRKAHAEHLAWLLAGRGVGARVLTGDLGDGERAEVVADLNAGKVKVLVATGQLLGEGFDCRELSTLFLATPIKFNGRVLQYLGRVLRPAPGKEKARVYDYLDPVGVLQAAARARRAVYG
jgi:superfamily II DNA or RNA helicase